MHEPDPNDNETPDPIPEPEPERKDPGEPVPIEEPGNPARPTIEGPG